MEDISKQIYKLELSLLTPEVRSSYARLNTLLADDFVEFGSAGLVYDKKMVLERLPAALEKIEYLVKDFSTKILSDDIVMSTFKTDRTIDNTEKLTSLRSSLWRKTDAGWQMFFHQGTPVK